MSDVIERLERLYAETVRHPLSESHMTAWMEAVDDNWAELLRLARLGLAAERGNEERTEG